jgi:hypothetical protein
MRGQFAHQIAHGLPVGAVSQLPRRPTILAGLRMPDRLWKCENETVPGSKLMENLVSQSGIILIIKPINKLNIQQVKNNPPLNYDQIIAF